MRLKPDIEANWLMALRRYIGASILFHLAWETLQLPLYTIWVQALGKQAFAVIHCTMGDAMIAALTMIIALIVCGASAWPAERSTRVYVVSLAAGIAYTIYSEWLNVSVRGSWAYSDRMPIVPLIGTGLAPLLQWTVVPTIAQYIAIGRPPWFPLRYRSKDDPI